MSRMNAVQRHLLASVACTLTDRTVHVWQIDYRRAQRREPLVATLAAYLEIDAMEVRLVEGEYGRPVLAAEHVTTLDFNWSHSGDRALIAIARGIAPGIDIERVRARPRALLVADRYFRSDEIAMLTALSEAQRSLAFLQLWTAKEAVLKALGRGIAFGLDRLEIAHAERGPTLRWLDGEDTAQWQLHRVDVGEGYLGALAWRGGTRGVSVRTLEAAA